MFKFLKEKLKGAVSKFSKQVEEEVVEEKEVKKKAGEKKPGEKKKPKEEKPARKKEAKKKKPEKPKKERKAEKLKERKEKEEEKREIKEEVEDLGEEKPGKKGKKFLFWKKKEKPEEKEEKEKEEEVEEEPEEAEEEKKKRGFFKKVGEAFTTKTLSESRFDEIFWELEVALLENNVAMAVIEKIKNDMKDDLVNKRFNRSALTETVVESLKNSLEEVLSQEKVNLFQRIKEKKEPLVICFFGINGSGKTTTIAKLAYTLKKRGISCVLAAGDTFRAAAIDQLQNHGDKIGVKVIKHEYGSDAAAVAYDAIQYAKARSIDAVLIDTAGRSHSNINLMDELKKIIRVANPDLKLFVGDSLTGNDMVEQAEKYADAVGIDGIILAKADVDEKGGATISASYVTEKPVYFLGTGQAYDDLEEFSKEKILGNLGLA